MTRLKNDLDQAFGYYLKRHRYKNADIRRVLLGLQLFIDWIKENGLLPDQIRYQNIMDYIDYCRSKGNAHNTITGKLSMIKIWLDYRGVIPNPCKGWQIKRRPALLPPGILSQVEVEQLYHNHPANTNQEIRDKVILSLMVYQAVTGGHLKRLTLSDVNVEADFIIIRKTAKTNSRTIKIHTAQKELLVLYINQVRAQILTHHTDKLIVKSGQMNELQNFYGGVYKRLRKRYPKFKNINQVRASVISNWLKHHNLRQVQYMAGHRYVSSTERYMIARIEDLQKQLDQLHPLK